MTLAELRALFRQRADDRVEDYLFADADVDAWLNEAEREACKRKDLIHESEDADLCAIATTTNTQFYNLHAKVLRITRATWTAEGDTDATVLTIVDRVELDRIRPLWRDDIEPQYLIVEDGRVRLPWTASTDGALALEVYRLPLDEMVAPADPPGDERTSPEIAGAHHEKLIDWALHRAFGIPDTESFDKGRGEQATTAFDRYFGPPPDADRFRPDEERPNVVKAWV